MPVFAPKRGKQKQIPLCNPIYVLTDKRKQIKEKRIKREAFLLTAPGCVVQDSLPKVASQARE